MQDEFSFLDELEKQRLAKQTTNNMSIPQNRMGENIMPNSNDYWAKDHPTGTGGQGLASQEQGGYFDAALRGMKSQAAGALGGQADFVSAMLGTDGSIGSSLQGVMQRNNRRKNYEWKDIMSRPMDYIIDPEGLAYDVGGGFGSSGVLGAEGLALAATLPANVTAIIGGGIGAAAAKLGLKWVGKAMATPAGMALIGNILKSPLEGISEGGNVYREMTRDQYGNPIQGADKEAAKKAMYTDAAINSALLTFSNSLESMGLGNLIAGSGGKNAVIKTMKGAIWDFLQNGYEEGAQQGINQFSQNKGTFEQIINPFVWNDEQKTESLIGGITGLGQGAVMTGGGLAANKVFGKQKPNNIDDDKSKQDNAKFEKWIDSQNFDEATMNSIAQTLNYGSAEEITELKKKLGYDEQNIQAEAKPQNNTQDKASERESFINSIAEQESGGDYNLVNKDSGATGKYQIMPENWAAWSKEAGLEEGAEMTPENQEKVARFKLGQYYDKYGPRKAAIAWYAGEGALRYSEEALNRKQGDNGEYPSINEYADSVVGRMGITPEYSFADMENEYTNLYSRNQYLQEQIDELDKQAEVINRINNPTTEDLINGYNLSLEKQNMQAQIEANNGRLQELEELQAQSEYDIDSINDKEIKARSSYFNRQMQSITKKVVANNKKINDINATIKKNKGKATAKQREKIQELTDENQDLLQKLKNSNDRLDVLNFVYKDRYEPQQQEAQQPQEAQQAPREANIGPENFDTIDIANLHKMGNNDLINAYYNMGNRNNNIKNEIVSELTRRNMLDENGQIKQYQPSNVSEYNQQAEQAYRAQQTGGLQNVLNQRLAALKQQQNANRDSLRQQIADIYNNAGLNISIENIDRIVDSILENRAKREEDSKLFMNENAQKAQKRSYAENNLKELRKQLRQTIASIMSKAEQGYAQTVDKVIQKVEDILQSFKLGYIDRQKARELIAQTINNSSLKNEDKQKFAKLYGNILTNEAMFKENGGNQKKAYANNVAEEDRDIDKPFMTDETYAGRFPELENKIRQAAENNDLNAIEELKQESKVTDEYITYVVSKMPFENIGRDFDKYFARGKQSLGNNLLGYINAGRQAIKTGTVASFIRANSKNNAKPSRKTLTELLAQQKKSSYSVIKEEEKQSVIDDGNKEGKDYAQIALQRQKLAKETLELFLEPVISVLKAGGGHGVVNQHVIKGTGIVADTSDMKGKEEGKKNSASFDYEFYSLNSPAYRKVFKDIAGNRTPTMADYVEAAIQIMRGDSSWARVMDDELKGVAGSTDQEHKDNAENIQYLDNMVNIYGEIAEEFSSMSKEELAKLRPEEKAEQKTAGTAAVTPVAEGKAEPIQSAAPVQKASEAKQEKPQQAVKAEPIAIEKPAETVNVEENPLANTVPNVHYRIAKNNKGGVDIFFDDRIPEAISTPLKANGFRFSKGRIGSRAHWWARQSDKKAMALVKAWGLADNANEYDSNAKPAETTQEVYDLENPKSKNAVSFTDGNDYITAHVQQYQYNNGLKEALKELGFKFIGGTDNKGRYIATISKYNKKALEAIIKLGYNGKHAKGYEVNAINDIKNSIFVLMDDLEERTKVNKEVIKTIKQDLEGTRKYFKDLEVSGQDVDRLVDEALQRVSAIEEKLNKADQEAVNKETKEEKPQARNNTFVDMFQSAIRQDKIDEAAQAIENMVEQPTKTEKPKGKLDGIDFGKQEDAINDLLAAAGLKKPETKKTFNFINDSPEAEAEAWKDLGKELSKLSANPMFNPDLYRASLRIGLIKFQQALNKGSAKFQEWAEAMFNSAKAALPEQAESLKPFLGAIYKSVETWDTTKQFNPKIIEAAARFVGNCYKDGLTTYDQVKQQAINSFGEENTKAIEEELQCAFRGIDELANGTLKYEEKSSNKPANVVQSSVDTTKEVNNNVTNSGRLQGVSEGKASERLQTDEEGGNPGRIRGQENRGDDSLLRGNVLADVVRRDPGGNTNDGENSNREPKATDSERASESNAVRARLTPTQKKNAKASEIPGHNFTITPEDNIGKGGPKAKFKDNVAAIRLLKQLESEKRQATPEEQKILAKYVGWGGLADAFNTYGKGSENWKAEQQELKELLTEDEYMDARRSTMNAHYTSPDVIKNIWKIIERLGFKSGRVLEPSMGIGNFFGLMPESMRSKSSLNGVELDSITGRIAKQLYQKANIDVSGYQDTKYPDNYFDLIVSNVPFGDYKINDPKYNKYKFNIHNYFFAKAIDQARPGGLVVFITSTGTMQSGQDSERLRQMLKGKADLVGAIRLPNTSFKENAGTEVTTDLIVLRKIENGEHKEYAKNWFNQVPSGVKSKYEYIPELTVNEYYKDNPDMLIGKLVEDKLYVGRTALDGTGLDVGKELEKRIEKFPENIYTPVTRKENPTDVETAKAAFLAPPKTREGAFVLHTDGKVYKNVHGKMEILPAKDQQKAIGYTQVRDITKDILAKQLSPTTTEEELQELRKKLNKAYDVFVKKFGYLHSKKNDNLAIDPEFGIINSIENYSYDKKSKKEHAIKARIFTERTVNAVVEIKSVGNVSDALALSLSNTGKVDVDYMAKLTDNTVDEVLAQLGDMVYENPQTNNYETADEYLSGNVREKLELAEFAAKTNPSYKRNVEALKKVQPKDLVQEDITVNLGVPWVPASDIMNFASELLGINRGTPIVINYVPTLGSWKVSWSNDNWAVDNAKRSVQNISTWGTPRKSFYDLLDDVLNKRTPKVYDTDYDTKSKVLNQKETVLAQQKAKQIEQEFKKWIWKDKERSERLLAYYNRNFNNWRLREYDGSHLTLPGYSAVEPKLRDHQKNAVWRIMQGGNTLLAHCVGAGKTWTMQTAAMELKRLGLARKSMFVIPNHMLIQFEQEFRRIYPNAKLLTISSDVLPDITIPNAKKLKPTELEQRKAERNAKRQEILGRIATEDWDGIIISHSLFKRIPLSAEETNKFIQEQIDDMREAIIALSADKNSNSKRLVKELEKKAISLEEKLKKDINEENKDIAIPFEQLGIDQIFVDEADLFKNLGFTTKMANISGMSNTNSQRSMDMYMKTQYISRVNGGRGVCFATGTPISNTMAEMFTMLRYLDGETLKNNGTSFFDNWASTFTIRQTAIERSPDGNGYRQTEKFTEFTNVPELIKMFRKVADIKNQNDLKLDIPKIKNGKPTVVEIEPSEALTNYIKNVISERADKIHNRAVDPSVDNMLKLTGDLRKASLDMRLVDPRVPAGVANGKIVAIVNKMYEKYKETENVTGVQVAFCDLSTPKAVSDKANDNDTETNPDEFDELPEENINVYDEIKKGLIKKGVPAEQIAFIHDAKTKEQKENLFARVREGSIRFIIGSTEKMGAGTNFQNKLVALHDIDCPWRPRDIEQRHGRILRQGNENKEVEIFSYVTKDSYDANMWEKVKNKATMINQAMSGDLTSRSIKDVGADVVSFAEIEALASGNPLMAERVMVNAELSKFEVLRGDYIKTKAQNERKLETLPSTIKYHQDRLDVAKQDQANVVDLTKDNFSIKLGNKLYTKYGEAKEALEKIVEKHKGGIPAVVGEIGPFKLKLRFFKAGETAERNGMPYTANEDEMVAYLIGNKTYECDTSLQSIVYKAMNGPEQEIKLQERQLEKATKELEERKRQIAEPFEHEEKYQELKKRSLEIDKELHIGEEEQQGDKTDKSPQFLVTNRKLNYEPGVKATERIEKTPSKAEKAAGQAIINLIQKAGIDVVTDKAEMSRVLGGELLDIATKTTFGTDTQFLRTSKGEVYGFVKDGKIYVDPDLLDVNTPLHEYTHLWDEVCMKRNPALWRKGKALMKQTSLWNEVKNNPAYANIKDNEDKLASEVHARLTGQKGAEIIQQMAETTPKGIIAKLKEWLKGFWLYTKDVFRNLTGADLERITIEDWQAMPIIDIVKGTRLGDMLKDTQNNYLQGMDYTVQEVEDIVRDNIESRFEELSYDFGDIKLVGLKVHGSRARNTANKTSDLDIVLEYEGDIREDTLFNILNEEPIELDGVNIDINPIRAEETGTLEEYLARDAEYDKEKLKEYGNISFKVENEPFYVSDLKRAANEILPIRTEKVYRTTERQYDAHAKVGLINNNGDSVTLSGIIGMYIDREKQITKVNKAARAEILERAKENALNSATQNDDSAALSSFYDLSEADKIKRGVAAFMRLYARDKKEASIRYPAYYNAFEKMLAMPANKALKAKLENYTSLVQRYEGLTEEGKARASMSKPKEARTIKDRILDIFNYSKWFDDKDAIREVTVAVVKQTQKQIEAEKDPYIRARLAATTITNRISALMQAPTDKETRKILWDKLNECYGNVMENKVFFSDIISKADELNAKMKGDTVEAQRLKNYLANNGFRDWNDVLQTYLLANRFLEIWKDKPNYTAPMTKGQAQRMVDYVPKEIREAAELYYKFDQDLLRIMKFNGLLSEEAYKALNKYEAYCPLFRDFADDEAYDKYIEHLGSKNGFVNVSNGIKYLTKGGSDRTVIDDPIFSMMKMTAAIISKCERNSVAQYFVAMTKENGMGWFAMPAYDAEGKQLHTSNAQESRFTVYENGEKNAYRTTPEIYKVLEGNADTAGMFMQCLNFVTMPARALRIGATSTPGFIAANAIRDTMTAAIISRNGFMPFWGTLHGLKLLYSDEKTVADFKLSGAAMGEWRYLDKTKEFDTLTEMAGGDPSWYDTNLFTKILAPIHKYAMKIWKPYMKFAEAIENSNRIEEFYLAKKAGKSNVEAAIDAKEVTTDFTRGGEYGRIYNQITPFFNATLQGGNRLWRALKEQPRTVIPKMAALSLLAIVYWSLYHDEDWWKEKSNEEKMSSIFLPYEENGKVKLYTLPYPHEIGLFAAGSSIAILEKLFADNPEVAKDFAQQVLLQTTPSFFPAFIRPLMEVYANYDFYFNSNIETQKDMKFTKESRIGNTTSKAAIYAGKASKGITDATGGIIPQLSPKQFDHIARGYFGEVGKILVHALDDEKPGDQWLEMPILGPMLENSRRRFNKPAFDHPKSVDDWYNLKASLAQYNNTHYNGKKPEYMQGINNVHKAISKLTKQISAVRASNLPEERKQEIIYKLNVESARIARIGLRNFRKYKK